jgi:hypothetical protein
MLSCAIQGLPLPHLISDINVSEYEVRLSWFGGTRLVLQSVGGRISVWQAKNGVLDGGLVAILAGALINRRWIEEVLTNGND